MKNKLENPDEQASSKQSPGEQYRAGKQTSAKDYEADIAGSSSAAY